MKLQLGDKIKELRKRDGRKQEELASAMGVSPQAVSRWESGSGYPDMELIPAIANYFHVAIDELFGYDFDREERIVQIITQADEVLWKQRDTLDAVIETLRTAAQEYPSEARILLRLGQCLVVQGTRKHDVKIKERGSDLYTAYDAEYNAKNEYVTEALSVLEKVVDMNISPDEKAQVVLNLSILYTLTGNHEKAKALAVKQPTIGICREFLLTQSTVGNEQAMHYSSFIIVSLRLLKLALIGAIGTKYAVRSSEYALAMLESLISMYHAMIEDGNFGVEHSDLMDIYITGAFICVRMNDIERAKQYFALAVRHDREYRKIREKGEFSYSSELFSALHYTGETLPVSTMMTLHEWCKKFPETFKAELANEEAYREYFTETW